MGFAFLFNPLCLGATTQDSGGQDEPRLSFISFTMGASSSVNDNSANASFFDY